MKKTLILLCASLTLLAGYAEEAAVGKPPYRICVLDFSTADTVGMKRFLDGKNRKIETPQLESLNSSDRLFVNRVMQGYIRMIDANDAARTNEANRAAQIEDNRFERAKALELYNTVVKGESRPVLLGGETLSALLGSRNDLFRPVEVSLVTSTMEKLARQPGFPADFQRMLALESGVKLLVYGTVSDLRSREETFRGYGVETKNTVWQLDLILKVADLEKEEIVYSNIYTGTLKERQRPSVTEIDNDRFQTLLDSALKQGAEDLIRLAENNFRAPAAK